MNGAITEVYLTSGETNAACATRFIIIIIIITDDWVAFIVRFRSGAQ